LALMEDGQTVTKDVKETTEEALTEIGADGAY
jgi:hypothetical protein